MPVKKETSSLSVPMYSIDGKESGKLELPKEIFGMAINRSLIAQATRVYLNNQKAHFAHTKTRAEVKGSSRKIYKQKGTGGARHGSIRANIFVGGGVALGPKSRKIELDLPRKMKKIALYCSLSLKASENAVIGLGGIEKLTGKTSQFVKLLLTINQKNALIVLGDKSDNLKRAVRNIPNITSVTYDQLNLLEILKHKTLIMTSEAVTKLGSPTKGEKE